MSRLYYDLHVHSCLSPCGDDDMTPANIAGMAKVKGLDMIALTDHNSSKNCPAFFEACREYGIIPVAGMELTTAEDIHVVCLFPTLDRALDFDSELDRYRILIKNKAEIFGEQHILDKDDNIIGNEEYLLSNATMLPIEQACELAKSFGAAVYPAHIDRDSNGIIATLGMLPDTPRFTAVEYHLSDNRQSFEKRFPELESKKVICSSDAHYLWDIHERENFLELDADAESAAKKLIGYLNEGIIA